MKNKILGTDELRQVVSRLKKEGKKVVATSGCFDIIHAGHVTYLEEAAAKGDVFVLFLNSDSSVRGLKGNLRDRKSTRLNSSHIEESRMPSSA